MSDQMVASNLVDLAQATAPPALRCVCGLSLRLVHDRLVDGAGSAECWDGGAHVVAVAARVGGWLGA